MNLSYANLWTWSTTTTVQATSSPGAGNYTPVITTDTTYAQTWAVNFVTNSSTVGMYQSRQLTEEESRHQREELERARTEYWRRERERELEQVAARRRAQELLLSQLDAEQRAAFLTRKAFRVVGADGKLYEIARGRQHNVFELDAQGRRRTEFCITHADLPDEDILVAQKLLLETDVARFRRIANATPVAA